jgi:hypothetical protein
MRVAGLIGEGGDPDQSPALDGAATTSGRAALALSAASQSAQIVAAALTSTITRVSGILTRPHGATGLASGVAMQATCLLQRSAGEIARRSSS